MAYSFKNCPPGWEIKKMPQVVKWGSGGTPKATEKAYYEGGTIPWLIIGDLNDGIVSSSSSKITELGLQNSSAKMIPAGTLLVAMYGSIGKLGITGIECCTNQAIAYAKELYGVTTEYMFYFMAMIKSELIAMGKGGTQKNISQTVLNSLDVIVPPIEEQKRIVERIEELLSQLDDGVETLQKTQEQLEVYRRAVIQSAFCGDYPKVALCDISETIGGYAFKSSKYTPDGKYTVVKIGNVKDRVFDFNRDLTKTNEVDENILKKYLLKSGDCLITLTGSRGKRDYGFTVLVTNEENYLVNQRVAALRFNREKVLPEYAQYYLASPSYRNDFFSYETGNVGQGNVGVKALSEPLIPLPSIEEQQAIVAKLEQQLSEYENIKKTVSIVLQQSEAMRQSILKQAFEGRL